MGSTVTWCRGRGKKLRANAPGLINAPPRTADAREAVRCVQSRAGQSALPGMRAQAQVCRTRCVGLGGRVGGGGSLSRGGGCVRRVGWSGGGGGAHAREWPYLRTDDVSGAEGAVGLQANHDPLHAHAAAQVHRQPGVGLARGLVIAGPIGVGPAVHSFPRRADVERRVAQARAWAGGGGPARVGRYR